MQDYPDLKVAVNYARPGTNPVAPNNASVHDDTLRRNIISKSIVVLNGCNFTHTNNELNKRLDRQDLENSTNLATLKRGPIEVPCSEIHLSGKNTIGLPSSNMNTLNMAPLSSIKINQCEILGLIIYIWRDWC